jgi:hypothetical protein
MNQTSTTEKRIARAPPRRRHHEADQG